MPMVNSVGYKCFNALATTHESRPPPKGIIGTPGPLRASR